jgi:GT2 family glycosyltransferase
MRIGAVIVSYKNEKQTKKCLKCLGEDIPKFTIDNSINNLGFTKAYNLGVLDFKKKYEYILLINSDCYIHSGFIDTVVKFMDEHIKCGIAGVKQLSSDGKHITHGGCLQAYPNGVHLGGFVSMNHCSENSMMPWINGACFVVRSQMIEEIGLMDENFFLIGSDSDWCYTARSRGWEVWYVADAVCTHDGGVSQNTTNEEFEDLKYLDMKYWESKWVNGGLFKKLENINQKFT